MSLLRFLLARDSIGHAFAITYKGSDQFPTLIGAILTILIKCLVIVQLVKKSIDLVEMSDPSI